MVFFFDEFRDVVDERQVQQRHDLDSDKVQVLDKKSVLDVVVLRKKQFPYSRIEKVDTELLVYNRQQRHLLAINVVRKDHQVQQKLNQNDEVDDLRNLKRVVFVACQLLLI